MLFFRDFWVTLLTPPLLPQERLCACSPCSAPTVAPLQVTLQDPESLLLVPDKTLPGRGGGGGRGLASSKHPWIPTSALGLAQILA